MFKKAATAWLLILALLLAAPPTGAQEKSLAEHPRVKEALHLLDMWLESVLEYERIPGISVAVVSDQDLIWTKGYGYANLEERVPAEPDTIYSICSISKLFTSISVMQLRDAGRLRLDDPLDDHLSWFEIVRSDPNAPPITIGSILTHSSGLPRESDQPYDGEPDIPWAARESVIEKLPSQVTMYPPRTQFQYSNLGISLLGEMVAEISGMTFQDYVLKNIIMPIGMKDTTPYLPEGQYGKRLAIGYSRWERKGDRQKLGFFQANGITPAAGLASTAIDLGKFASWQFRAIAEGKNAPILSGYTLKEMHRVHWVDPDWETKWGLGFSTWRNNDTTFVGHGGSCPGYRTQLLINPEDKIAAVVMANAIDVNPRALAQQVHDILKPAIKEALNGEEQAEAEDDSPDLTPYFGIYKSIWQENVVFPWKGKLAMLYLPTDNPLEGIQLFEKVGEHTFKRILDNGKLHDTVVFEFDEEGKVKWFSDYNYYSMKVR